MHVLCVCSDQRVHSRAPTTAKPQRPPPVPGAGPAPNILGGRGRTAGSPLSGTGGLVAIGGRATPGGSDGPGARPGLASPAGAVCRRGRADAGAQALAGCGRGPGAYRSAGGAGFPQPAGSAGWAGSEAFEALSAVAKNVAPGELERAAGDAGFRLGLPPLLDEMGEAGRTLPEWRRESFFQRGDPCAACFGLGLGLG